MCFMTICHGVETPIPAGEVLLAAAVPPEIFLVIAGTYMPDADKSATTVAREFSRDATLCTIRWMTHGCPASAPVCHMNVIGFSFRVGGSIPHQPL
jgi:hypothetical protein